MTLLAEWENGRTVSDRESVVIRDKHQNKVLECYNFRERFVENENGHLCSIPEVVVGSTHVAWREASNLHRERHSYN